MYNNRQFKRRVIAAIDSSKDILDNNPSHDDTTVIMASKFGVSRNALQAAFKQRYGITVREYKLQQRMELSRLLLEEGKDVKQVSLEVHYATQSGFTSAFKRYFGITPTEYLHVDAHTIFMKRVQNRKR